MKQHITVEQTNELSDKGKKRLRAWWKQEEGDKCYIFPRKLYGLEHKEWVHADTYNPRGRELFIGEKFDYEESVSARFFDSDAHPLLSIGQMIQYLDEHISNKWFLHTQDKMLFWGYKSEEENSFDYSDGELCDALWSACKEILNKE